jgi:O-antigen/teichoic acid export membrane protein
MDLTSGANLNAAGRSVGRPEFKRLWTHLSHYLAGMVGAMAIGLISFPIFTRVFSVSEFGTLDLAQKVVLALTAASKMGLQNAAIRLFDAHRVASDNTWARTYYSTMLLGAAASASLCVLVLISTARLVPASWTGLAIHGLIYLISALILIRALNSILCAFLRVEERTAAYNTAVLGIRAATVVTVCGILPWAGRTAATYLSGAIAAEGTAVLLLTLWLARRGLLAAKSFDLSLFTSSISFGLPLVVYESAFTVLGSADRFLVTHYLGRNALGFYSVAYGLAETMNEFLITPLNLALMPIYVRLWTTEGRERTVQFLTTALNWYLLAALGVLAVASASAKDLVLLLASPKYAGADRLIPWLLAGLLTYTTHVFLAAGLFLSKRTIRMAGILMAGAFMNVCLNIWLLPRLGLMGGAIAAPLSYAFCMLLLAWSSHRLLALKVDLLCLGRCTIAAAGAWLFACSVRTQPLLFEIVARAIVGVGVYLSILLLIDPRVRGAARNLRGYLRTALRAA